MCEFEKNGQCNINECMYWPEERKDYNILCRRAQLSERFNSIKLIGTIKKFTKINVIAGRKFDGYKVLLKVQRTSPEASDTLIVLLPRELETEFLYINSEIVRLIDIQNIEHKLEVDGFLQSIKDFQSGRLISFVYANNIRRQNDDPLNVVDIYGEIAKATIHRKTPKGRDITESVLKVPSALYDGYSYIPFICWGNEAKKAAEYNEGDFVTIKGRMQSRRYTKNTGTKEKTRIAYELSARSIEREG